VTGQLAHERATLISCESFRFRAADSQKQIEELIFAAPLERPFLVASMERTLMNVLRPEDCGYRTLRPPSFQGLRDDKDPTDVIKDG
jgi:hypothetical protein